VTSTIEAFYAQYQRDPATLAELTGGVGTDGPVLKEAPTNFTFNAPTATTGASFTAPTTSPCYVAPAAP
jgi:hypothetical protein